MTVPWETTGGEHLVFHKRELFCISHQELNESVW